MGPRGDNETAGKRSSSYVQDTREEGVPSSKAARVVGRADGLEEGNHVGMARNVSVGFMTSTDDASRKIDDVREGMRIDSGAELHRM